jgi:hypothetical protein
MADAEAEETSAAATEAPPQPSTILVVSKKRATKPVVKPLPTEGQSALVVRQDEKVYNVPAEARLAQGDSYISVTREELGTFSRPRSTQKENPTKSSTARQHFLRALTVVRHDGRTELLVRAAVDDDPKFEEQLKFGRRLCVAALRDVAARLLAGRYNLDGMDEDAVAQIREACAPIASDAPLPDTMRVDYSGFTSYWRPRSTAVARRPAVARGGAAGGALGKRARDEQRQRDELVLRHVSATILDSGLALFTFKNLADVKKAHVGELAVTGLPIAEEGDKGAEAGAEAEA